MCVTRFVSANTCNEQSYMRKFCFFSAALRESPVKRRSRLSKMVPGSEREKEMMTTTPVTVRNDRGGLNTSPIQRRSYEATPLTSNQSDTRYENFPIDKFSIRTHSSLF